MTSSVSSSSLELVMDLMELNKLNWIELNWIGHKTIDCQNLQPYIIAEVRDVMFSVSYMAFPLPLSLSLLLTNDHTVAISGGMSCTSRWVWGSYSTDCRLCYVIWRTWLPPCWHLQSKEQVACINYQNILTWHFSLQWWLWKSLTPSGLAHTCQ
jgi:hypothetical protein